MEAWLVQPLRQRLQIGAPRAASGPSHSAAWMRPAGERGSQLVRRQLDRRCAERAQSVGRQPLDVQRRPGEVGRSSPAARPPTRRHWAPVCPASSGLKPNSAASSSHSISPPPTASQVCWAAASRPWREGQAGEEGEGRVQVGVAAGAAVGQIGVGRAVRDLDAIAAVGGRLDAPREALGPEADGLGRPLRGQASSSLAAGPDGRRRRRVCGCTAPVETAVPAATAAAPVVLRKSRRSMLIPRARRVRPSALLRGIKQDRRRAGNGGQTPCRTSMPAATAQGV